MFYRDLDLRGFAVRATMAKKVFIAECKIKGKTRRITIGGYPEITVVQAREKAQALISDMVLNRIDSRKLKEDLSLDKLSINDLFDYCSAKKLRYNTVHGYNASLKKALICCGSNFVLISPRTSSFF